MKKSSLTLSKDLADSEFPLTLDPKNRPLVKNKDVVVSDNTFSTYNSTCKMYRKYLLEVKKVPPTLRNVLDYLPPFFSHLKDISGKPRTLSVYKTSLKKPIQQFIVRNGGSVKDLSFLDKIFSELRTGIPDPSFTSDKMISTEEMNALVTSTSKRISLIISFLYRSAVRISELINLRLGKTNIKENGETVLLRVIGKGEKERWVVIPTYLYTTIKDVFNGKKYLFESKTGKQLHRVNIYKDITRVSRRIIGRQIHPHQLRHVRATNWLERKNSLRAVAKRLGHSNPSTTSLIYDHSLINERIDLEQDKRDGLLLF